MDRQGADKRAQQIKREIDGNRRVFIEMANIYFAVRQKTSNVRTEAENKCSAAFQLRVQLTKTGPVPIFLSTNDCKWVRSALTSSFFSTAAETRHPDNDRKTFP